MPTGSKGYTCLPTTRSSDLTPLGGAVPFNWKFGYFWTNRGIEYALLWLLLCTAIFFRGGGRYSLDRLIGKEF
jgi:uncharacterized membrane protein YphA (DoxX/SURF4 family)